jgi:hypothetical protein
VPSEDPRSSCTKRIQTAFNFTASDALLGNITLEVGDKWLGDETVVKVNGKEKYLWSIMDYETRRYIASLLTQGRSAKEASRVIKKAIKEAGKQPQKFITDGNVYTEINGATRVDWEKPFTGGPEEYGKFWKFCKDEAARLGSGWTPRDVEKALFTYGENK